LFLFLLSITVNARDLYLRMDLFNNSVYSNHIYMTTDDGGLVSFNPQDSSWNSVNSTSGLPSNETKDLFIKGDSVFVLSKGGISIFNEDLTLISFQTFNPILFTQDTDPYCIRLNKNKVILGGQRGIQWFNLNNFDNLSRVERRDYDFQVFEILPLDTCYLLGTNRGVFKSDSNFEDTTMIDSSGDTYSLFVSGNSIWAGGSWGCKEITADTAIFSDDTVWTIGEIDEDIYIGTRRGLYRYEGVWQRIHGGDVRGFARVSPLDPIVLVVRGNGIGLVGSSDYIYTPGLASNLVTDLVQTPDGKIYVCHKYSRSISVFDGVGWEVLNRGNSWGLSGGYLFNIESDSEGRIYFGLWYWELDTILYCWDTQNDTMPRPIDLPIPATTVTGMLVDSNDDLWLGLMNRFNSNNWVLRMHWVSEDSLEWTIYSDPEIIWKRVFAEGSEGIYCGNSPSMGGAGIHILYDDRTIEKVIGNLGSSTVSMSADIEGNIWAGLETGLAYITGESVDMIYTASNSGLSSDRVDGLAVDFQGGIWCYNSESGLSYFDPEGSSLPLESENLPAFILEDVISPLHFTDNNNLFVGTYAGLYEFDLDFNYPDSGKINVYPNPFNYERHNRLNFSARDLGGKNIFIYDIIGDIKEEYEVPPEKEVFWIERDHLDLTSGLYMYFIVDEGRIIHKGKFVVVR